MLKTNVETKRSKRAREGGGAAVEFAIVLPLFCAVVFGIIDFGWYYYQRFTLAAAVRDGARYGSTIAVGASPDPWTSAQARAAADLVGGAISAAGVTWGPAIHYSGATPTQLMTLSASMTFTPLVGFVPHPASMSYSMTTMLELQ